MGTIYQMVSEIVEDRTTFSKLLEEVICDYTKAYCKICHV